MGAATPTPKSTPKSAPKSARRLLWFVALWAAGVAAVACVSLLLRFILL
jgi:fatty acid desaturase